MEFWPFAVHVRPGATLYVQVRNCRLQVDSSPTARAIDLLQPGDAVVWQGSDPKNQQWQRVVRGLQSGVIYSQNLSPTKPGTNLEPGKHSGPIDPQAFPSHGSMKA